MYAAPSRRRRGRLSEACGRAGPKALILALGQRAEHSAAKLERYQRQVDGLVDPDGADLGPSLTLARGIAFERENIDWSEMAAERLRRHAARGDQPQLTPS